MHLIVASAGFENFILEGVDATSPVAVLRLQIAERLHVEARSLKLVVDGVELLDGVEPASYRIADFYVSNLATIRCIVPQASASARATGASAAAGTDLPSDAVLQNEEVTRAIVVLGLPQADAAATEKALFSALSTYGEISRLLFQDEPALAGAGLPHAVGQRAVVVYHRDDSAAAALAADGSLVLGHPVHVVLATNLPALHAAGAASTTAAVPPRAGTRPPGSVPLIAPEAAAAVASLLAHGALFGERGVAHLRRYDDSTGLSRRVKVMLGGINERYHIVSTVRAGYEAAAAQAHALNAEYKVSETVELGVANALATAAALAQRAMANPLVAQVVTSGQSFVREAMQTVEQIAAQAREEVRAVRSGAPPPPNGFAVTGTVISPPPSAATAGSITGIALPLPGGVTAPYVVPVATVVATPAQTHVI